MTIESAHLDAPAPSVHGSGHGAGRVVFYALSGELTDASRHAIDALARECRELVLIGTPRDLASMDSSEWGSNLGVVRVDKNEHRSYYDAVEETRELIRESDQLVFTGDGWFGPAGAVGPVLERMTERNLDHWLMLDPADLPAFPEEGFPPAYEPWIWTTVNARVLQWSEWTWFWRGRDHSERAFAQAIIAAGGRTETAFPSGAQGPDAAVFAPDVLLSAGCPLMRRTAFGLYPPLLHQRAFMGRQVLRRLASSGYPVELALDALSRSVAPKALNTSAGLLEIVPTGPQKPPTTPMRIVVIAHVSDIDRAGHLRRMLRSIPPGWDLVVTTGDGRKAARLAEVFIAGEPDGPSSVDIRVTPGGRGRDMGDFFVACRDLIHSDRYDLIVKIHARPMRRKTANVRRYFRRYQLENLMGSADHVRAVLRLFEEEARLGLVFPPMMHVGFATMGRAWAGLRERASALCDELGISVPLDVHSPLAPFGAMWIARPAALRRIAIDWRYRDYGKAGRQRYGNLAHLQERLVVVAAAQDGFHSRTVLAAEHASISHTALEFKVDQLFSTTTGYPLDQIRLMHRAGRTGHGGIVGLSRMYLSLNHRAISTVVLPALLVAERVYGTVRHLLSAERSVRPTPQEDEL